MSRGPINIRGEQNLIERFHAMNWGLIILIVMLASVGFVSLYSAAGGDMSPWASRQMIRFFIGMMGLFMIALIPVKWWYRLTWPCYFVGLALLLVVEVKGHIGMGAQRWLDLGVMQLQPSEIMKIAVIMALARYFHATSMEDMKKLKTLIIPAAVIAAPVALVLIQPDLGTALMIVMGGATMIFMAGAPIWLFGAIGIVTAASIPLAWRFMHDYQKQRVLTFLHPETDPLGSGYHIIQSKIALGSGGIGGKGFMEGTQSRLNFLPEKQTDFIFTLWAEEWGVIGGLGLMVLLGTIFIYGIMIALSCRNKYSRYLALGLSVNFSLYTFINIGMVMGLLPVVGVPLPMMSYGGTAMLSALIGFGLIISCSISRHNKVINA